jgi:hypothetical protein
VGHSDHLRNDLHLAVHGLVGPESKWSLNNEPALASPLRLLYGARRRAP